jgi:hypothetical protein
MQVALRGRQRPVPGDRPQHVHRDTGVGHPRQAGVSQVVIRTGNETADWLADDQPHLLTLGMAGYTKSGVIGRPSLGTRDKGAAALTSLVRSFEPLYGLLRGHGRDAQPR